MGTFTIKPSWSSGDSGANCNSYSVPQGQQGPGYTVMVLPENALLAFIFSVYAHICGKDGEKPL